MKLLAALTFLLPAVHAVPVREEFGLIIGAHIGMTRYEGFRPERFKWGPNGKILNEDGQGVFVDDNTGELGWTLIDNATSGFYLDEEDKLAKNYDERSWYLCPLDHGYKKMRFSINGDPDCEAIDIYKIPLQGMSHA